MTRQPVRETRRLVARGLLALCVASTCVLGSACPDVRADPAAEGAAFLGNVDRAIDLGVERLRAWWLEKKRADSKDAFRASGALDARVAFGEDALVCLAVLAGLDGRPFDELFDLLESIRARWRAADSTYGTSLALMLFAEARRQADRGRETPGKKEGKPLRRLPAWLDAEAAEMARAIARWRSPGRGWHYGGVLAGKGDVSNTQFAVRALLEARQFGVRPRRRDLDEILAAVLALRWPSGDEVPLDFGRRPDSAAERYAAPDAFVPVRGRDRGFRYAPLQRTSASTTSAAVVILASLRTFELDQPKAGRGGLAEIETALCDGLAWLAKRHAPGRNLEITFGDDQLRLGLPGIPAGDVSTVDNTLRSSLVLWNLAQAMDLLHLDGPSRAPWYRPGAEHLISTQKKDGRWQLSGEPQPVGPVPEDAPLGSGVIRFMDRCDTAFAVLFLRRARQRFTTPEAPRDGAVTGREVPPGK